MKIYLAGPVMHTEDGGERWREVVGNQWKTVEWLNPVDEMGRERAQEVPPSEVVENDKAMLREADGVLVGLTRHRSVGTWREVEYAKTVLELPIALWLEPYGTRVPADEREFSPWVYEAGHLSASFVECLDYLKSQHSPIPAMEVGHD